MHRLLNASGSRASVVSTLIVMYLVGLGCGSAGKVNRKLYEPELQPLRAIKSLNDEPPFLKAHLKDGSLIVFDFWSVDEPAREIFGSGKHFSPSRSVETSSKFRLHLSEVVVLETNEVTRSMVLGPLSLLTGASIALTIFCLTNTKACFGSCPTFYVATDQGPSLAAEGFSSSIAPSLAAVDVDAVGVQTVTNSTLSITMKNEALETHVVRRADLLLFPKYPGEEVWAMRDSSFARVAELQSPGVAWDDEAIWTEEFRAEDGIWRSSVADSFDLAVREDVFVAFEEPVEGSAVICVSGRQSLMTTFLFYQSLAWMGRSAGEWFSRLERMDPALRSRVTGVGDVLGGIEVWEEHLDKTWHLVGSCGETGPLATDAWAISLPDSTAKLRSGQFKLRAAQGLWRIDEVALGKKIGSVEPIRLQPQEAWLNGVNEKGACEQLTDDEESLVTWPGDIYEFVYRAPDLADGEYDVFVESEGYYWEWMRQEWLDEEDPEKVTRLLFQPAQTLVDLAPEFKEMEASMERLFWGSQYVHP